jgi:hypothetical protein
MLTIKGIFFVFLAKPERPWQLEKKSNQKERKDLRKVREDFENSTLDSHKWYYSAFNYLKRLNRSHFPKVETIVCRWQKRIVYD